MRNYLEIKSEAELYNYVIKNNLIEDMVICFFNNPDEYRQVPVQGKFIRQNGQCFFTLDENAWFVDEDKDYPIDNLAPELLEVDPEDLIVIMVRFDGQFHLLVGYNTSEMSTRVEDVQLEMVFKDFVKCVDIKTIDELNKYIAMCKSLMSMADTDLRYSPFYFLRA